MVEGAKPVTLSDEYSHFNGIDKNTKPVCLENEGGVQYTISCLLWVLYAKVTRVQSFVGRLTKAVREA